MKPSICTNSLCHLNIDEVFYDCARHGFAISIDIGDVKKYGLEALLSLKERFKVKVSSVSRVGFFTDRDESIENDEVIALCRALDCNSITVVAGGFTGRYKGYQFYKWQIIEEFNLLSVFASQYGIKLYLEPFHPMYTAEKSVVNTLSKACSIIEMLEGKVGLVVDTYHLWHDDDFVDGLLNILNRYDCMIQISDWPKKAEGVFFNREMVGEGVVHEIAQAKSRGKQCARQAKIIGVITLGFVDRTG